MGSAARGADSRPHTAGLTATVRSSRGRRRSGTIRDDETDDGTPSALAQRVNKLDLRLLPAALLVATACGTPAATPCEAASRRIADCFGVEYEDCNDGEAAKILAAESCEAIAERVDPNNKQDGGFCPKFLWWVCGKPIEKSCAAAGASADYSSMWNDDKLNYHWQWGLCTEYGTSGNPELAKGWKVITDAARGVGSSLLRLERVFTNSTDELDAGRRKLLHPYGSLVEIELVRGAVDESCHTDFTGIWSQAKTTGLARLGWGQDPKAIGYVPGIAMKFFVVGRESVNLHLIHSLDGDPDKPNFFSQSLTNVLPLPTSGVVKVLVKYFKLFADEPLHLRLDHLAAVYSDGATLFAEEAIAPYQIVLEPSDEARQLYQQALDTDAHVDFRAAFTPIPAGTKLYDVYVTASADGCRERLGTLRTKTRFVASQWGDERLYFQHAIEGQGYERVEQ